MREITILGATGRSGTLQMENTVYFGNHQISLQKCYHMAEPIPN